MTYEVEIAGRIRRVAVRREGDGFAVTVDRRTWHVDAARIDPHSLSLIVDTPSRGEAVLSTSVDATIVPEGSTDRLVVTIGATPVSVALNGRRWRSAHAAASDGGPLRITTPMPGKIVRMLVKPGDAVSARQPVAVVEAMKMENELRAGRNGTVAEVHGREGASVEAGALLVVIR